MLEKLELRQELRKRRSALDRSEVRAAGERVAAAILASDAYKNARVLLGFLSFGKELSVDLVLEAALAEGKTVAVPLITSAESFVSVRLLNMSDFELDRYGIRTVCQPAEVVPAAALDLILVPGVAFGRDGSRMGMGAGYYDRFLPQAAQAVTMGVAYDCLLQDTLPCDEHDVKMQLLVSESGIKRI